MTKSSEGVPGRRSDTATEPAEESNLRSTLVGWIPFVPLLALVILIGVFVIYAEILR